MSCIVAEIHQEVQEIFQDLTGDASVSLSDVEKRVSVAVDAWGQKLSEAIISETSGSAAASPVRVSCPSCQGQSRRFRRRVRCFTSLCGVLRLPRWEYKCQCGHIHVPWDAKQLLKGRYTQAVAAAMMRVAAQLNYRAAAAELKHQGIEVSHTTLHQKVQAWSSGESVSDYVAKESLDAGARWYVSCDGCHTHSRSGWQEVKVGSIGKDYPHQHATSVMKIRPSSLRYVASRDGVADFQHHLAALATQTGIYQDENTMENQEVVVIGDGAAWIWNLADQHFPEATEILDYMHAKTHLYDVAKHAFGEDDTQTIETWVNTTETSLYNGETSQVVARIRALETQNPDIADVLEREVGYFQKHSHRMQYRTFNDKGYQIGSGVIESACKHIVAERCKQAGMRWTRRGINAILFWRCLLKNDTWDTYWDTQTKHNAA